jgi:hypothetical protein
MSDLSINLNGSVLSVGSGGTGQSTYTDGQLLIGKTDGTLAKSILTAGAGITVTNGDGAVTVAADVVDLATADVTGTLPAAKGGTGQSSYTLGDMLYASAPNALTKLATGSSNTVLLGGGLTPAWGKVTLPNYADGLLTVGLGGTGQSSYTDGQLLIGNTNGNTLSKATLTAGSGISITNGSGSITVATTGVQSTLKFWIFEDRKATSTSGGNSTVGTTARLLNTVFVDGGTDVTLNTTTGVMTFAPGTYCIDATVPGYGVGAHQLTFYGVTAGGAYSFGTCEYAGTGTQTKSQCVSHFTIAGTESMRLDHYTSTAVTDGLGKAVGASYEIYSRIVIVKTA